MAKADIMQKIYAQRLSPLTFNWDRMFIPSMYNYLSSSDIQSLYNIASSVRYSANLDKKYKAINEIMTRRGFRKLAAGTNRTVYKFLEDQSFVAKIAIDRVGISDNPNEWINQNYLKPFVSKVFEVSQCGTIALCERVQPILSTKEFESVLEDVFNLLMHLIGEYILSDIGNKYFMNYGIRVGFGLVLLDFPYCYKLDGNKLYCNRPIAPGVTCGGVIDYDNGFNDLVCEKCGKVYKATDLKEDDQHNNIIVKDIYNTKPVNVKLYKGNQKLSETSNDIKKSKYIIRDSNK